MGKNIVLIGLPGSGKSTVGQLLAEKLGRPFMETDAMAEAREGRAISAIFAAEGEAYFRNLETACAKEAAAAEDTVIATGGGIVLRRENMDALGKTGAVYFLDRSPGEIASGVDVSGRPLLAGQREMIFRLHKERIALYRRYARAAFAGGTPEELAEAIALMFEMTE